MFQKMSQNKFKIILIVLMVVLVIAAFSCWWYNAKHANDYSVVYITTGEVYVGKLSTFNGLTLKDSYILQVTKDATDPTKSNFQLNPVNQALWAPQSIHLIKDNVVFYGPLLPTSKIAETIAAQKAK
jgi:hypothetical protein